MKAVANGSTWVLATEAGGTVDSGQIVVQQKLASITVTPANRNLYLGTSFNYTAQAVDGLGTPLPSNPTFTWSTTAPAVATVDTATTARDTCHAIGLGTAQIKATSGTITGVGNLSVLTAITRIAVAVDLDRRDPTRPTRPACPRSASRGATTRSRTTRSTR